MSFFSRFLGIQKLKNLLKGRHVFRRYCLSDKGRIPASYFDGVPTKGVGTIHTLLTWNVQELFLYHHSRKVSALISYLRTAAADVICLQEVFEPDCTSAILTDPIIRGRFPFYLSGIMRNKFLLGENSGLLVLSSLPLSFVKFIPLLYEFPDSLANKGCLFFCVGGHNFAVAHLQSENELMAGEQLKTIVRKSPFGRDFIMVGDLNHEYAELVLGIPKNNTIPTHDSGRILDYILPLAPVSLQVVPDWFGAMDISDHFPLYAHFLTPRAVLAVGQGCRDPT